MKFSIYRQKFVLSLIFLLSITLLIEACGNAHQQSYSQDQMVQDFVQRLNKDSLIVNAHKNLNKLEQGLLSDRYHLSNTDMNLVKNKEPELNSSEEIINLYKKAGMTHAEEYYTLSRLRFAVTVYLQNKYPELYKLPEETGKTILKKVFSPLDSTDVVNAAQTRITKK